MHLLYLDDSGSVRNAADTHIILAGLSIFEQRGYGLSVKLDKLAERLWPDNPASLEFHGTEIFSGKKQWRGILAMFGTTHTKKHCRISYKAATHVFSALRSTVGPRVRTTQ